MPKKKTNPAFLKMAQMPLKPSPQLAEVLGSPAPISREDLTSDEFKNADLFSEGGARLNSCSDRCDSSVNTRLKTSTGLVYLRGTEHSKHFGVRINRGLHTADSQLLPAKDRCSQRDANELVYVRLRTNYFDERTQLVHPGLRRRPSARSPVSQRGLRREAWHTRSPVQSKKDTLAEGEMATNVRSNRASRISSRLAMTLSSEPGRRWRATSPEHLYHVRMSIRFVKQTIDEGLRYQITNAQTCGRV